MTLFYIHSLITGDYVTLKIKLLIVTTFWVMVIVAMISDLLSGVHKAKIRGEMRTSELYKRTVSKLVLYFSGLICAFAADVLVDFVIVEFNSFIPAIPYMTIAVSLFLIFIEYRSIREKAEEKTRKAMDKGFADLVDILSKIKDKEVIEGLKKMTETNRK